MKALVDPHSAPVSSSTLHAHKAALHPLLPGKRFPTFLTSAPQLQPTSQVRDYSLYAGCQRYTRLCSECMLHAESLTAAVSCLGALHDVPEHLLHHLAVGKTAAIALALSLLLQALVRMKQQHQLLLDQLGLLLVRADTAVASSSSSTTGGRGVGGR